MLEGGFGRTKLGDVLLELSAIAMVLYEEAMIPLVCILHLLRHSIVFSFECGNLICEYVIRGHGIGQGLRPCREVNSHSRKLCFGQLVLCGEMHVLGREVGVGLHCLCLVVLPRCLGSVELFGVFVALGLFNK